MTAAGAAQGPKEMAAVPQYVRQAVIVEVGNDGEAPGDIRGLRGGLHSSDGAGEAGELSLPVVQINLRPFAFQGEQVRETVVVHIAGAFDGKAVFSEAGGGG